MTGTSRQSRSLGRCAGYVRQPASRRRQPEADDIDEQKPGAKNILTTAWPYLPIDFIRF
jgi:hypothetical protein